MPQKLTRRERYLKRWSQLKNERSSWEPLWKDIDDWIEPRMGRWSSADQNSGTRKDQRIINGQARIAFRQLASGIMAGASSPSQTWFRLALQEMDLDEDEESRRWLSTEEERMRKILAASNVYLSLSRLYEELIAHGTAVLWMEEDERRTLWTDVYPVGTYWLASGAKGEVDTLYRECIFTVAQTVEKFGLDACGQHIRRKWEDEDFDEEVRILHVVEPRALREESSPFAQDMPWASVWVDIEGGDAAKEIIFESGFEERPFAAPRWFLTSGDVYGRSPAMDALGDTKALQKMESKKLQALAKYVDPPLAAPSSLQGNKTSLLPGEITYYDASNGNTRLEPIIRIDPSIFASIAGELREHERRINSALMADIMLMMSSSDRRQITAREVEERSGERALQLGPVLERLQYELFSPLIERLFGIMVRAGKVAQPPEELAGREIKVEFVSILAAAQKVTSVLTIERFAGFTAQVAAALPSVLNVIDPIKLVKKYAELTALPPSVIRTDDELEAVEQQQQAQQMMAQQAAMAQQTQQLSRSAKDLSQTKLGDSTALDELVRAQQGPVAADMELLPEPEAEA